MKVQAVFQLLMLTAVIVMLAPDIKETYRHFSLKIYHWRKQTLLKRVKHLFTVSEFSFQYTEAMVNQNEALQLLELNELQELYNRLK